MLALDIVQNLFNAYVLALPMVSCLFLFQLGAADRFSPPRLRHVRRWLFLPILFYILWYAAGSVAVCTASLHPPKQCPVIDAPGFERIYFSNFATTGDGQILAYATQLNSGLELLRANKLDGKRVFALDFINPFPFLLAAPYPQGQPVWMHGNGTFSREHYIPAETIFAGTDVILLPRESRDPWYTTISILIYGDWILAHYDLAAKNDHWVAYVKKKP